MAAATATTAAAAAAQPAPPHPQPGRRLLWGGGGGFGGFNGGFFGDARNGNDYNAQFNQFGGGMAESAFYGGRYGPVGAFGNAGNVACGTVGLAYRNVPCTGALDRSQQLNAFGIGGRTAPGGVVPGVTDSIPLAGSSGAQAFGGSPFDNAGQYGGFVGGLPNAGSPYGGGSIYGVNGALVAAPYAGGVGRRLLRALGEVAGRGW
jgi:hypothetical protein